VGVDYKLNMRYKMAVDPLPLRSTPPGKIRR
jgi:hypothetical protein